MRLKINLTFYCIGIFYPSNFYYLEVLAKYIIYINLKLNFYHECKPFFCFFLSQKGLDITFRRLKVSPSEGPQYPVSPLTISLYLCFRKIVFLSYLPTKTEALLGHRETPSSS